MVNISRKTEEKQCVFPIYPSSNANVSFISTTNTQNMLLDIMGPKSPYTTVLLSLQVGQGKTYGSAALAHIYSEAGFYVLYASHSSMATRNFTKEYQTFIADQRINTSHLNKIDCVTHAKLYNLFKNKFRNDSTNSANKHKLESSLFNNREYGLIILDEVHNLRDGKNRYEVIRQSIRKFRNTKVLLITGTPMIDHPKELETLTMFAPYHKKNPSLISHIIYSGVHAFSENNKRYVGTKTDAGILYISVMRDKHYTFYKDVERNNSNGINGKLRTASIGCNNENRSPFTSFEDIKKRSCKFASIISLLKKGELTTVFSFFKQHGAIALANALDATGEFTRYIPNSRVSTATTEPLSFNDIKSKSRSRSTSPVDAIDTIESTSSSPSSSTGSSTGSLTGLDLNSDGASYSEMGTNSINININNVVYDSDNNSEYNSNHNEQYTLMSNNIPDVRLTNDLSPNYNNEYEYEEEIGDFSNYDYGFDDVPYLKPSKSSISPISPISPQESKSSAKLKLKPAFGIDGSNSNKGNSNQNYNHSPIRNKSSFANIDNLLNVSPGRATNLAMFKQDVEKTMRSLSLNDFDSPQSILQHPLPVQSSKDYAINTSNNMNTLIKDINTFTDFTRKKRVYAVVTGDTPQHEMQEILNKYTSIMNKDGSAIEVLIGTSVITESISLRQLSNVHILHPFWNYGSILQAIGRATRMNSHTRNKDGSYPTLNIYLHASVAPSISELEACLTDDEIREKIKNNTFEGTSSDLDTWKLASRKQASINEQLVSMPQIDVFDTDKNGNEDRGQGQGQGQDKGKNKGKGKGKGKDKSKSESNFIDSMININSVPAVDNITVFKENSTNSVYDLRACIEYAPSKISHARFFSENAIQYKFTNNGILVIHCTLPENLSVYSPPLGYSIWCSAADGRERLTYQEHNSDMRKNKRGKLLCNMTPNEIDTIAKELNIYSSVNSIVEYLTSINRYFPNQLEIIS